MNDSRSIRLTYEDFEVGDEIPLAPRTVTAEEIIGFASEFDPQPMHLDEEAGRASMLGGLSASGWHTSSVFMRMMCDAFLLKSASQGAPGVDYMKWKRPVLAGDTLSGKSIVLGKRVSASRPEIGLVKMRHRLFNQDGVLVAESQNTGMLLRRDPEAEA